MREWRPLVPWGAVIGSVALLTTNIAAWRQPSKAQQTQVVLLGTGKPLLKEMSRYPGQIVVGRDLDVY